MFLTWKKVYKVTQNARRSRKVLSKWHADKRNIELNLYTNTHECSKQVNKSKQETPAVSTLNLTYSRLHMISTIWYVRNTMALTWYMGYTTIKYENQIKFTLDLRVSLSSLETTDLEHHTTSIREHVLDWPVAMNSDISLLSWTCDLGCLLLPQHLNPPPKNVIALFMPLYLNL